VQRLTLTIPVNSFVPGDGFAVFANVDAVGAPTDAIDYDSPITGNSPVPFWPLVSSLAHLVGGFLEGDHLGQPVDPQAGHLEIPWLTSDWLGLPPGVPADHEVSTPLLYLGLFLFAVQSYDAVGNASDGDPYERRVWVNSGPQPARNFRQTDVEDGRPVFGFTPPAQLAA